MSVDYNFEINVTKRAKINLTMMDIVKCYLEAGWSLYSEKEQIIYTGVGDNDDFDFLTSSISEAEYSDIVKQKEKNRELIAFALFFLEDYCRYRINVIITPEYNVLISPDDATKKMLTSNLNILDVNWYLQKILQPLSGKNMLVESFSFMQTGSVVPVYPFQ